jgi:hypothetical protein
MLGISWLKQHDLWIHWSRHRIMFNAPYCLSLCHIQEPTTVVVLEQYPHDSQSELHSETPHDSQSELPVEIPHDSQSEWKSPPIVEKNPLSSTPEESPPVVSTVAPLALPRILGEDRRDENDGQLRVLPPSDPVKVIRRKVLRKSRKKDTVDQAKPKTKSTPIMPTAAVSMIKGWKEVSPVPNRCKSHRQNSMNHSAATNCGIIVFWWLFDTRVCYL